MRPSRVREHILADHDRLRILLDEVDGMAARVLDGGDELTASLRERGAELQRRFLRHLELEEEHLVPALRTIDAWGEERASRVLEEHAAQRETMAMLLRDLADETRPARALAHELRGLIHELRRDMDQEERDVLDKDLLRDDVINVDVEAG